MRTGWHDLRYLRRVQRASGRPRAPDLPRRSAPPTEEAFEPSDEGAALSRSGTLVDASVADADPHYGAGPVAYVGAGTGIPNEGPFRDLGPLRDDDAGSAWISVGTEESVTISATNSLDQTVTVEVEGFLFDPDVYVAGDLLDDGNWTAIDTMVITAGSTDTSVVDLTSPTDYDKIRVRYTYSAPPSGGLSADEEQTINLGDVATVSPVTAGQSVDTPLTPDASGLPAQDFNSLPIGARGSLVDNFRSNGVAQTGAPTDEPFGNPIRPSFTLTYNTHETARVYYDLDITDAIQTALEGLADFAPGDVTVTRTSTSVYTVDFGGAYAGLDVSAISITNRWGFTPTGVTVTDQGGDVLTITWEATRGDNAFSGIPVGT